jgi:membrane protease YdiL (CAAX protease family)
VRVLSAVLVPTLAGWNNFLAPRLSAAAYTGANAVAAGALLTAARTVGLSWSELGLEPRRFRCGVRAGAAVDLPLAAGYAVALALPAVRPVLADARVAGLGGPRLAADVLVRIPVGTVLWEEIAFRGVLHAALDRLGGARVAAAAGPALFGVWHVAPTLAAVRANAPAATASRRHCAVLAACTGSAAAGLLFTVLRQRSGSLLAPALVHLAANSLGLLTAVGAHRLYRDDRTSAAVGEAGSGVR